MLAGFLSCYAGRSAFSIETQKKVIKQNEFTCTHSNRLVVIINAKWKRQKVAFVAFFLFRTFLGEIKWLNMLFSMLLCSLFCIHEYVSISIHGQSRERTLRYRNAPMISVSARGALSDAPQISFIGHIQHANEEPKFNCNILLVNFKLNDSRLISATKRWPMLDMPHACRCNCFDERCGAGNKTIEARAIISH